MYITKENVQQFENTANFILKAVEQFKSENNKALIEPAPARMFPERLEDLPEGYYSFVYSYGETGQPKGESLPKYDNYPTDKAAVSARAFAALSHLIHYINDGWEPLLNRKEECFVLIFFEGKLHLNSVVVSYYHPQNLYFKNRDDAEKSMQVHRKLWIEFFTGIEQTN